MTRLRLPPPSRLLWRPLDKHPLLTPSPLWLEKTLTSTSALEGERTQVTVLCADLKDSMELRADRDAAHRVAGRRAIAVRSLEGGWKRDGP